MRREVRHFLQDIVDMIDVIEKTASGRSMADYHNDVMLRLGLERAIEIISEASRHVPEELKALHPEVPWAKIRGIGNILRHEYHGLSAKIIWGVIEDEIPKLRFPIAMMKRDLGEG